MDSRTLETAEKLAFEISQVENIDRAYIDDYNDKYSVVDFQIVAILKVHKGGGAIGANNYWPDTNYEQFSLRKTSNDIRKILRNNKSISKLGLNVTCPRRVYYMAGHRTFFDGYEKNYIMIDFII